MANAMPWRANKGVNKGCIEIARQTVNIVYGIKSAAYGVIFTSCLCQNPNERGTSE